MMRFLAIVGSCWLCLVFSAAADSTISITVIGDGTVRWRAFVPSLEEQFKVCPTDCSAALPDGTQVEMQAIPATGEGFIKWEGICAGQPSDPCYGTLAPGSHSVVTARFTSPEPKAPKDPKDSNESD